MIGTVDLFRERLMEGIELTRRRSAKNEAGVDYILAQLEDVEARTRSGARLPDESRRTISFDTVANRQLDDDDDYCELLSQLADFARRWPVESP